MNVLKSTLCAAMLAGCIAGQARARGWTVVTENRREFDRVDGLTVIDWTEPQD